MSNIVKPHITRAENFLGKKIKYFRTENGGGFVNDNFDLYFKEKGIMHEHTNPFPPQQNRVIERFMQEVADGARPYYFN